LDYYRDAGNLKKKSFIVKPPGWLMIPGNIWLFSNPGQNLINYTGRDLFCGPPGLNGCGPSLESFQKAMFSLWGGQLIITGNIMIPVQ